MKRPSPPESVEEALRRAATHGRRALAESIAACRALLDAASLVAARRPAGSSPGFATLAGILDELEAQFAPGAAAGPHGEFTGPLVATVAESLEAEIARWERRAARDPEARAVLRAFLGLRELLWELGVRADSAPPDEDFAERSAEEPRREPARVQRIRVHG